MNLLNEPWIPVRRRDGNRAWIAPHQLSEADFVAFDADRPDFNGALAQFAIGLLQTTTPVDSPIVWSQLFSNPPDAPTLKNWFAAVVAAFEFDGAGARFMQDRSLQPDEGATNTVGALLIESPGEQTLKNNADHFVKRGQIDAMCPHCVATALLTLQTNAPSGGAGHRTGLRGGGPLTTLMTSQLQRSLWHDLWLNVQERSAFLARCGDPTKTELHFSFPWLADISSIQKEGGETAPIQIHPAHIFWAMPRRIRLDFDTAGECSICGRASDRLVRRYITKNYGLNYKGPWDHPLSPYYETKEGWLPLHPQPGGFGYRHWLAWVFGISADKQQRRRARVVNHVLTHRKRETPGQLRLWAFGYDMDNMKARCWYESTLPLYGLEACERDAQQRIESEVGIWLAGAEMAARFVRGAVKDAWFGRGARGDFSAIDASFWSRTEPMFYQHLQRLIETVRNGRNFDALPPREAWHRALATAAITLFDEEFVGTGPVERQNPQRIAKAFQQMRRNLWGPKIRLAFGMPVSETAKTKGRTKSARGAA
ncbi:MAG: type I-E CRISPR-associated protein Cse1/CasA [Burkholderiales bacterium]